MNTRTTGPTPDQKPSEAWVIRVVGDLDVASAPGLRNRIARAADDPTREVVVDLSAVSFLDCTGLDTLLLAQDQLGSRFSLRWPSIAVLWLVGLTSLHVAFSSAERLVGSPGGAPALPTQRVPR